MIVGYIVAWDGRERKEDRVRLSRNTVFPPIPDGLKFAQIEADYLNQDYALPDGSRLFKVFELHDVQKP